MTQNVEIVGDGLGVQIIGGRDIVVSSPEDGLSVTYRKDGFAQKLVAIEGIGRSSEPSRVKFWAQAWKGRTSEGMCSGLAEVLGI